MWVWIFIVDSTFYSTVTKKTKMTEKQKQKDVVDEYILLNALITKDDADCSHTSELASSQSDSWF